MKPMALKTLENLLAGLQLFHCMDIGQEKFSKLWSFVKNCPRLCAITKYLNTELITSIDAYE